MQTSTQMASPQREEFTTTTMVSPPPSKLKSSQFLDPSMMTPGPLENSHGRSRAGSTSSRRQGSWHERSFQMKDAEEEYNEMIHELEQNEEVTEEDVSAFKKTLLIQKCVNEVKQRALEQDEIRHSPEMYKKVKSRIKMNMRSLRNSRSGKSMKKLTKEHKGQECSNFDTPLKSTMANDKQRKSNSKSFMITPNQKDSYKKQRESPFDISEHEFNKMKNMQLNEKSLKKLQNRDEEIRKQEEQLEALKKELQAAKALHEKLTSSRKEKIQSQSHQNVQEINQDQDQSQEKKKQAVPATTDQFKVQKKQDGKSYMRFGGKNHEEMKKATEDGGTAKTVQVIEVKKSVQQKVEQGNTVEVITGSVQFIESRRDKLLKQQQQEEDEAEIIIEKKPKTKSKKLASNKKDKNESPEKEGANNAVKSSNTGQVGSSKMQVNKKAPAKDMRMPAEDFGQQPQRMTVKKAQAKSNTGYKPPTQQTDQNKQKIGVSNNQIQVTSQQNGNLIDVSIQKTEIIVKKQESEMASEELSPENDKGPENFATMFAKEQKHKAQRQEQNSKFLNKNLEEKTLQMQEEFNQLMEELNKKRQERDGEAFYQAINEYYYEDSGAHQSPTKRLIQQKNTTFTHKKTMKDNIEKGDYSLVYCPSPGKSYVIEPHGGELDYKVAEKNPLKFYEQVFTQDITQHTVGKDKDVKKQKEEEHKIKEEEAGSPLKRKKEKLPVTVKSKVTKRPHLKIMAKLQQKIAQKLQEKIGQEFGANILEALKEKAIDAQIQELIKQDKLKIVDQKNTTTYEAELEVDEDV